MKTIKYIDPPEGWKYGFPKKLPDKIKNKDINNWLISQGYPKELIESYGDSFIVSYWTSNKPP
jgi:hypothetical protein